VITQKKIKPLMGLIYFHSIFLWKSTVWSQKDSLKISYFVFSSRKKTHRIGQLEGE